MSNSKNSSAYASGALKAASLLLSSTALTVIAPAALAQDAAAEAPAENEIVVEGIRATIQGSIAEKRDSVEVFDALSAEEIGDLPALSIGEALETLTGAGSHREQGGATEISIRGLGPFLGSTVINGRVASNGSGDRSVNFSQFPSELFSKVGIYKTQAASYIEGGVAGQIVLETVRPLDYGKQRLQGDFKLNINPNNLDIDADQRFQKYGYRGTVSYVDQFNVGDGELGISLGYSRSNTSNPEQEVNASNTIRACVVDPTTTSDGIFDDGNCDTSGDTIDGLRDGTVTDDFVIARNSYNVRSNITEDTRDSFFGAVQYKPTPDIDINADFQYSKRLFREQRNDLGFVEGRRIDPNNAINNIDGYDLIYTDSGALRQFTSEQRIEAISEYLERDEEYWGGGLSLDAQVSDRMKISLDASYSQTQRIEEAVQIRFRTEDDEDIFGNTGAWVPSLENDGSTQDDRVETAVQIFQNGSQGINFVTQGFDVNDYTLFANDPRLRADLEQDRFNSVWAVRGDVEYEVDGFFSKIMAGTRYQQLIYRDIPGAANGTSRFENTYNDTATTGALATANQECRTNFPTTGFLSSITGGNALFTNLDAAGNVISSGNTYATFDPLCIARVLEREDPSGLSFDEDGKPIYPTGDFDSIQNTNVEERSWAGYVQADFDTDMGSTPLRGNVGVRVVHTSVESTGFRGTLSASFNGAGELIITEDTGSLLPVTGGNSYTEILPSVNLVAEFQPELLGRFAVYRSLSRPDPSDLSFGRTFNALADETVTSIAEAVGTANATGNPFTDPLLSWNVDAGLEWYPNSDTILAFNAYYKSFDGGFETVGQNEVFSVGGEDLDTLVTTTNVTDDTSTIYGIEITAAHRLSYLPAPLDGLGFKLSYNYADADFEFQDDTLGAITTINSDGTRDVSNGLIPPANLFGFSKHVLSAQVYYQLGPIDLQGVYKYRSNYFQQFIGTPGRIRYTDDVSVFEARASFKLNDNVRFTVEGLNLFNEPRTDFRGAPDDLGQVLAYGPRYFAGVRFKF
ncbi:TonB-dependent receptor [Altererythrobacter sp. ZODW24]|uniref:TonB-dependent receptor n=1 Tax=Altererythrobacter sp. ZODW24 TaxID=2185142 RepID=UPI0013B460CE|nr:TonB-dependent receptor [Altererythrobacter sp. ZODW24]